MDAATLRSIEANPALDKAVCLLVKLWAESDRANQYGKTNVSLVNEPGKKHILLTGANKETHVIET